MDDQSAFSFHKVPTCRIPYPVILFLEKQAFFARDKIPICTWDHLTFSFHIDSCISWQYLYYCLLRAYIPNQYIRPKRPPWENLRYNPSMYWQKDNVYWQIFTFLTIPIQIRFNKILKWGSVIRLAMDKKCGCETQRRDCWMAAVKKG